MGSFTHTSRSTALKGEAGANVGRWVWLRQSPTCVIKQQVEGTNRSQTLESTLIGCLDKGVLLSPGVCSCHSLPPTPTQCLGPVLWRTRQFKSSSSTACSLGSSSSPHPQRKNHTKNYVVGYKRRVA